MPIPVKFYSVTAEQYKKIQEKLEAEKKQAEQEGNTPQEDGGIYFVSDANKGE